MPRLILISAKANSPKILLNVGYFNSSSLANSKFCTFYKKVYVALVGCFSSLLSCSLITSNSFFLLRRLLLNLLRRWTCLLWLAKATILRKLVQQQGLKFKQAITEESRFLKQPTSFKKQESENSGGFVSLQFRQQPTAKDLL